MRRCSTCMSNLQATLSPSKKDILILFETTAGNKRKTLFMLLSVTKQYLQWQNCQQLSVTVTVKGTPTGLLSKRWLWGHTGDIKQAQAVPVWWRATTNLVTPVWLEVTNTKPVKAMDQWKTMSWDAVVVFWTVGIKQWCHFICMILDAGSQNVCNTPLRTV